MKIWLLILCNIPAYLMIDKFFFRSLSGLMESIGWSFTWDIHALFDGDYHETWRHEWKLFAYVAVCAALLWFEYMILKDLRWLF